MDFFDMSEKFNEWNLSSYPPLHVLWILWKMERRFHPEGFILKGSS